MMSRIDALVMQGDYHGRMRRLWLTVFLALVLVAGGLASASAAALCPMQAPAAHDCCPDGGAPPANEEGGDQDMLDCPYMQACRSASLVAPEPAPALAEPLTVAIRTPQLASAQPPRSAADGPFRPPRLL
jgi:hypothetical protein